MKKNSQWPRMPVRSPEEARRIFGAQSARLLQATVRSIVFGDQESGGRRVDRAPSLPTSEECDGRGLPKLPIWLYANWGLEPAVHAAYWAYRLAVPTARLAAHREALLRLADSVGSELDALAADLTPDDTKDIRFAALWSGLFSATTGIAAATGLGMGAVDGRGLAQATARIAAIKNLSPRNVAAAVLLRWGLHPLLTACAVIALDLLDEVDRTALHGNGIDIRSFAATLRKMRNRGAMAELGLGALYAPSLVGVPGPRDFLPTDFLGINDLVLRELVASALPAESLSSLGRAGWRSTLSDEELMAGGLTAAGVQMGLHAAPFATIAEEVARAFRARFSRDPRAADLVSRGWLAPIGLSLAAAAEARVVGVGDQRDLLTWIADQVSPDAGLYAAAILAVKIGDK